MTLRVGVVGGGLVAQAMHLHYLSAQSEHFDLVGLAEPSERVRNELGARYGIPDLYADHRALIEGSALDVVIVCSPPATHAMIVLDALHAGLHVFVEKPMCITLVDADAIIDAAREASRVVQVGMMKRYDPVFERMLDELPESSWGLRYISVIVNDPESVPYFAEGDVVRGDDIPEAAREALRRSEAEQVAAAVGAGDAETVQAFSDGYLGSLVHDVNAVQAILERLGEPLPPEVVGGAWWNGGRAVTGAIRLANGARWDSAWIQLMSTYEYGNRLSLFFEDSVRTLTYPSPWLKQSPTVYRRSAANGRLDDVQSFQSYDGPFALELAHFHSCVAHGTPCRTPPEQARMDIDVLTKMFKAAG